MIYFRLPQTYLQYIYQVGKISKTLHQLHYTSNSSHYVCPHVGYDVFYAMNCTILISKYVYFFLLAGY